MIGNYDLNDLHVLAAIIGIFATALIGLLGIMVRNSQLRLERIRFENEQKLIREKAEYDARALLRTGQLKVADELLGIIGRLVSTETKEKFDRDWFDLASLQFGRALLLNDKKFHSQLEKFCDYFWEYDEMETRDSIPEDTEEELQRDAMKLSQNINALIARQFSFQPAEYDVPSRGGKKKSKTK